MWLVVVRDNQGKICAKMPLASTPVTIGRSKDRSIQLESRAISRFHGRFEVRDGKPYYVDEGSANGSTVDGKPVSGAMLITELSLIELGREFRAGLLQTKGGMTEKVAGAGTTTELPRSSPPPPPARPRPTITAAIPPERQAAAAAAALPVVPRIPVVPSDNDLTLRAVGPIGSPSAPPAATPKPVTTFQSPIEGMQFRIPDSPSEAKRAVETPKLSDSMVSLLDQQIRGIQSQRNEYQSTTRSAKEQFEMDWRDAIAAARDLHGRLNNNPRVQYFVVTRDEMEVSVKISDNSRRGYCNLILSRRHPEKNTMAEGVVWFAEFGDEPRSYREPKDALEDFVRRIAGKLA